MPCPRPRVSPACSSRAIAAVQLAAWSVAGVLLLHKGLSTLAQEKRASDAARLLVNTTAVAGNATSPTASNSSSSEVGRSNSTTPWRRPAAPAGSALSFVALGLIVLAVGPAIVACRSCGTRAPHSPQHAFHKVPGEEPPPSYEDAVGGARAEEEEADEDEQPAPRYSALFGPDGLPITPSTSSTGVV